MLKHEGQKYSIFKRNLILQGASSKTLRFKKCPFYFHRQKQSIDLSQTFLHLEKKHPKILQLLANTQLFYIDQTEKKNCFLGNFPLRQEALVLFSNWEATNITLSYRCLYQKQKSDGNNSPQPYKKAKERTITQAKVCIQQWKKEFKKSEEIGKPLSRIVAAKNLGMSKKTLDDYARCLNMGLKYGFDFQNNSEEKISILRNFVKQKRNQGNQLEITLQDPDVFWQKQEFYREVKNAKKYD